MVRDEKVKFQQGFDGEYGKILFDDTNENKRIKNLQFLYTDRIPVDPLLHDIDQCLRLSAHFLGIGVPASEPVFPQLFTQKETAEASLFVQEHSRSKMHIAVHAGSSAEHGMDLKRWAPERFAALADRICGYLGADAFVLGGNEEAEIKKRVASAMKAPAVIVDRKDLRSTAAIINACSLMLCNDAGLMHIAACSGVPVAAVFGPTDEKRTAPAGKGHCIIRKPMEGFPVWTAKNAGDRSIPKEIDPRASLEALTVEDAWRIVEPWLVERWRAC